MRNVFAKLQLTGRIPQEVAFDTVFSVNQIQNNCK